MNSILDSTTQNRSRIASVILLIALCWSFSNAIYSTFTYNWPSGDETWHYSYSKRYLDTGETERENVHNYNSTTPVVILNVLAQVIYEKISGEKDFNKIAVRSVQIFWYLMLFVGIGLLASYLAGKQLAWWVVFLSALDPNLNAHASLVGTDLPFTAITTWVLLATVYFLDKPRLSTATLLGFAYGIAFCIKYSATFLALPISLALLVTAFCRCPQSDSGHCLHKTRFSCLQEDKILIRMLYVLIYGVIIAFVVGLIVNLAYSFVGTGGTLNVKPWYSEPFKYLLAHFGNLPLPFPLPFLSGFDHQFAAERSWSWNVIILGQHFPSGIWYYFIVNWLVKTSLAVVLLFISTILLSLAYLKSLVKIDRKWAIIIITFFGLLFYFSFIFRTQVGLRYAFPCLPIAYLLISSLIIKVWNDVAKTFLAIVILAFALIELLPFYGNGISFSNSIILDKNKAYQWLGDSNIDWFHNYPKAKEEIAKTTSDYHYNPIHILPGANVFTLNNLVGVMRNFDQYKWLRENKLPLRQFEHTHLFYHISKTEFDDYLNKERVFSENSNARQICTSAYKYKDLSNYPLPKLVGSWANPATLYSGCLEVSEESLFEVKLKSGWSVIGTYPREFDCQGWAGGAGTSLWFKFKPGMHPICAYVNDTVNLEWIQHSGKAKFALRIHGN